MPGERDSRIDDASDIDSLIRAVAHAPARDVAFGTDALPKRIAHFRITGELGAGAMGIVYDAFDERTATRVALKTLPSDDSEAVARFKREFRALQGIHHPNLVALHELVCDAGQWAFSMDLIEGVDFIAHVREWVRDLEPALAQYALLHVRTLLTSQLPHDRPGTARR
ncbi:MAG: protein kinase domain-containing protein [Polyangiaceae bacterium]